MSVNKSRKNSQFRFGITLSGGGARGIAHLGVLAALEKYGIKPKIISGTSMGALIGVFYAAGFSPQEMLKEIMDHKFHKIANWHLPLSGLVDVNNVLKILKENIKKDDFATLNMPFYCAVTNLNSGELEMKSDGKLFQWILASISIPVIFEPQIINGQTYVDGGLLNNLPTFAIRDKCDLLIGVNVNHNGPEEKIEGLKTIAERCFRLGIAKNISESIQQCDFLLEPPKARNFSTFAFNKAEEIYQIGYNYTEKNILDAFKSIDTEKISNAKKHKGVK